MTRPDISGRSASDTQLICPGCGGPKTRRAHLCRQCRLRANSVGEQVWTESRTPTVPSRPRTPQQNTVYHAMISDLTKARGLDVKKSKREVEAEIKGWASGRFGREIVSSTELTEIEMEIVIEHLSDVLAPFQIEDDGLEPMTIERRRG